MFKKMFEDENVDGAVNLMEDYMKERINNLSDDKKKMFESAFKKEVKSKGLTIFLAFLCLHYLYIDISSLKNWFLQGVYNFTYGGCLVWLIVDCMRMDKILSKHYEKKAERILNKMG